MTSTFATNSAANSAVSYLQRNSEWQSSSISKLSSGSRIVKASDDAASLAVGTKLKADITSLQQASTNASQAASMLQIADGALSRVGDALMRMKSLATQARSDVLSATERAYLNEEYQEMIKQVDFIADSTKFNGNALIDGTLGAIVQQDGNLGIQEIGDQYVAGTNVGTANGLYIQRTGDLAVDQEFVFDYNDGAQTIDVTRQATGETKTLTLDGTTATEFKAFEIEDWGITVVADNFDASGTALGIDGTSANAGITYQGDTQGAEIHITDADLANGMKFQLQIGGGGAANIVMHGINPDGTVIQETVAVSAADQADTALTKTIAFEGLGVEIEFANYDYANDAFTTADEAVVVAGDAKFQVGVTAGTDDIGVSIADTTARSLAIDATDITTLNNAETASGNLDIGIQQVNTARANVGAAMSRLEKINDNLNTTMENLESSRSVLMDVDVAEEMTRFSTNQVMTQAATAMLAQANQLPQNLMRLLQ